MPLAVHRPARGRRTANTPGSGVEVAAAVASFPEAEGPESHSWKWSSAGAHGAPLPRAVPYTSSSTTPPTRSALSSDLSRTL